MACLTSKFALSKSSGKISSEHDILLPDIDDIYRDILLAHNIDVFRHIVVLLLCIVEES